MEVRECVGFKVDVARQTSGDCFRALDHLKTIPLRFYASQETRLDPW